MDNPVLNIGTDGIVQELVRGWVLLCLISSIFLLSFSRRQRRHDVFFRLYKRQGREQSVDGICLRDTWVWVWRRGCLRCGYPPGS